MVSQWNYILSEVAKLPEEHLAKPIDKLFHHENTERILGVKWSPFEDSIGIQIPKFVVSKKQSGLSGRC